MSDQENFRKNLIVFLSLFKNRPNHLAKYFIDNNAFSDIFMKKILESQRLNDSTDTNIYFLDISDMNRYFNSLLIDNKNGNKSIDDITKELNDRLDQYLEEENYEEAIMVRDYMIKNNIIRIKK